MPFVNISSITDKLMGFSCLEGELHEMLAEVWNERFSPKTALLTTVDMGETNRTIRANVIDRMENQGFQILPGNPCGFAVFLDLTKELNIDDLKQINEAVYRLESALGCNNQIVSYFGYAGKASLLDKKMVHANIQLVQSGMNRKHKVWLIATALRKGGLKNCWKPAVVFLDILRRDSMTTGQLSSNSQYPDGCVGFFRYREYDNDSLKKLQQEEIQVRRWLGKDGASEFKQVLSKTFNHLEEIARKQFMIEAPLQPVHPDMYPEKLFKKLDAKKNAGDFARARIETESAVMATAKNIESQVTEFYLNELGNCKDYLMGLFEKADVSIEFVANAETLKDILTEFTGSDPMRAIDPLVYDKKGYQGPIQNYLNWALEHAIKVARKKAADSLLEAYAGFSGDRIQDERVRLGEELSRIVSDLQHVPNKEEFTISVLNSGAGMSKDFNMVISADGDATEKFLLCRNKDDKQWIEKEVAVYSNEVKTAFINEQYGGVVHLDGASLKGLYAVHFACTERRLNDLLD